MKAVDPTGRRFEYSVLAASSHLFPIQGLNLSCCWTRDSDGENIGCVRVTSQGSVQPPRAVSPRVTPEVPRPRSPEVSRPRVAEVSRPRSPSRENSHGGSRPVSSRNGIAVVSPVRSVSRERVTTPTPVSVLIDTRAHTPPNTLPRHLDPRELLSIDRKDIVVSSLNALNRADMHRIYTHGLKISFQGERGADYGGLLTEWVSEVSRAGFASKVFVASDTHVLSPNPAFEHHVTIYEFYGRFIAIALKERKALGVEFAPAVLKYMLGQHITLLDLRAVDPHYVRALLQLKSMDKTDLADFTFTTTNWKGEAVDLVPNGSQKIVTHDNINEYIIQLARYKMFTSTQHALTSMKKGFDSLFPGKLDITAEEMAKTLLGETRISVTQFAANVKYDSNTAEFQNLISMFWKVVHKFTQTERKMLLKFITGSETLPLGGFAALKRRISIEPYNVSSAHLPTSSTCGLQFRLPPYKTETEMRQKIIQAISGVNTFEFI